MPNEIENVWEQAGAATYAGIILFGAGLVGIVNGTWALRYDGREADLVVAEGQLGAWGWVALAVGLLMLAAGIGVFYGKRWARWTGIVLATIGIVWNVGWAEVQPTQSLISAGLFVSVIWALATTPVAVTRE